MILILFIYLRHYQNTKLCKLGINKNTSLKTTRPRTRKCSSLTFIPQIRASEMIFASRQPFLKVCWTACLFYTIDDVYLSACLSFCLSVCPSICLSSRTKWKIWILFNFQLPIKVYDLAVIFFPKNGTHDCQNKWNSADSGKNKQSGTILRTTSAKRDLVILFKTLELEFPKW